MDEVSKSIAKNVRSGRYFADAREWYAVRYLTPVAERTGLILIAIFAMVAGSVAVLASYHMFPIVNPYELVLKTDDTIDHYTSIEKLTRKGVSTRQVVAQYLIENYVTVRESYNYKEFEPQFKRMQHASSKKVFREFQHEMDLKNPLSRPVIYGKDITRDVKVLSFAFDKVGRHTEAAAVVYETIVDSGVQKNVERWGAYIEYTLSDIDRAIHNKEIEFIVTDYKVRKLD